METNKTSAKSSKKRKRKLTPEENRALNAAKPARNKYVEAARNNRGSFTVYDPAFML